MFRSFPKERLVRSEAYLRYVALLPCFLCGVVGFSQAAHADEGKGKGIKTSDLTAFPLCAERFMVKGCHTVVGASGSFSREERRALERKAAPATQQALIERAADDPKLRRLLVKLEVMPA